MPKQESRETVTRQAIYDAKKVWHRNQARLPLKDKVRILLQLQRQDYVLLQRHRRLKSWERPWEIEP